MPRKWRPTLPKKHCIYYRNFVHSFPHTGTQLQWNRWNPAVVMFNGWYGKKMSKSQCNKWQLWLNLCKPLYWNCVEMLNVFRDHPMLICINVPILHCGAHIQPQYNVLLSPRKSLFLMFFYMSVILQLQRSHCPQLILNSGLHVKQRLGNGKFPYGNKRSFTLSLI